MDWMLAMQWFSVGLLLASTLGQVVIARQNSRRAMIREAQARHWVRANHNLIIDKWIDLRQESEKMLRAADTALRQVRDEGGCSGCASEVAEVAMRFERMRRRAKMQEWSTESFSQPTVWEEP